MKIEEFNNMKKDCTDHGVEYRIMCKECVEIYNAISEFVISTIRYDTTN